ncbi:MSHA biogenesis protein MshQ [hydrothermal vent metagenome]|uniref:MSHA biogenesis protein MshQ n=1 Tax=hydrothermal vent metagenome TaxID=652676 RepID=A0A1W1EI18_9ZZZZ
MFATDTPPNSCSSSYSIATLDGVSSDISNVENKYVGNWSNNKNIYLKFTPLASGSLQLSESNLAYNQMEVKFYVGTGCDSSNKYNGSSNSLTHSSSFDVVAGTTYNVKLVKKSTAYMKYALKFSFTKTADPDPEWISPTPSAGTYSPKFDVGESINIPIAVSNSSGLTYRLSGTTDRAGLNISMDSSTGRITGSFTEGDRRNLVKFYALRGTTKVLERTIYLESNALGGTPPTLGALSDQNIIKGEAFNYQLTATEPDGDTITYEVAGDLPSGLTLNSSTGLISGTPTRAEEAYLTVIASDKDGNSEEDYLNIFVTEPVASVGEYSCNGEDVANINGATSSASKFYHTGEDVHKVANGGRYFKFKTSVNGEITIHYKTTKNVSGYAGHKLKIGRNCGGTQIHSGGWSKDDSKTFNVTSNTTYYIKVQEANRENVLNFDIDFNFVAEGGTPPIFNDITPNPYEIIRIDDNVSLDLSQFVTKTDGDDIISYRISLGSLPSGINLDSTTGILSGNATQDGDFLIAIRARDVDGESNTKYLRMIVSGTPPTINTIPQQIILKDTDYSLDLSNFVNKTQGDDITEYNLTGNLPDGISFNGSTLSGKSTDIGIYDLSLVASDIDGDSEIRNFELNITRELGDITYIDSTDDICYGEVTSTGISMGPMKMMYTETTPIISTTTDTLTNVQVLFEENGMNFSFMSGCGIDGTDEEGKKCNRLDDINMGPMSAFSKGILFNPMPVYRANDEHSVYVSAMMEFSMNPQDTLRATYNKNGVYYRGVVQPCQSTSNEDLEDEEIPNDNSDIFPVNCGVFQDGLQTRAIDSKVDFSSGSAKLYNNPDENLNTYYTPVNGGSGNDITCNNTNGVNGANASCEPSHHGAQSLIDPEGGMKYPSSFTLSTPVSTSNKNVNYTTNSSGTKLTENSYNRISSDWNSGTTSIPFEISTRVLVNNIKNGASSALITFKSADTSEYEFIIDKIETKENAEFKTDDRLAKNIKIGSIVQYDRTTQGSAKVIVDFQAKQTIKIDKLYIGHTSRYTLKAPYININDIKDISGAGQENIINIYANYLDIGTLDLGDATQLNIMPYTTGKKVVVKMNEFNTGSKNDIEFDGGTYYIKKLDTQGSGNGYKWNMKNRVNLIIEDDYETISKIGINSDTTGGSNLCNDSHSALNLFIFSYGNFRVHNDSRIVGSIYSKKDVVLGSASYVKGAVSADKLITLDNGTKVCYDSDLADSGYADCNLTGNEEDEPAISQCGIFPSALQTYNKLELDGGWGNQVTVLDVDNVVAPVEKIVPQDGVDSDEDGNNITYDASCDDMGSCIVKSPNIIDYNIPFKATSDLSSTDIDVSTTISQKEVGSYRLTQRDITVTFEASEQYSSGRKYMMIGNLDSTKKAGIKYIFKDGDYYINSWRHQGNDLTIEAVGKVRIFLKDDLRWEGSELTVNKGGVASNFFIFGQSDFLFPNRGSAKWDVTAFFYTKGDFTLSANANSGEGFIGGVTAENDLYLHNNAKFKYDPTGLDSNGMGDCGTFVEFSKPAYYFKEPAIDGGVEFIKYQEVNITLSEPVDYDVVVEYKTFDAGESNDSIYSSEFNESIHAEAIYDYVENNPNPEQVTIPAGEVSALVETTINRDNYIENDEVFFATIKLVTTGHDITLGSIKETNLTIAGQTEDDVPMCFEDDFDGSLDDKWRTLFSSGGFEPKIVDGKLRLTDREHQLATAVTKDYYFLAKWNLIEVEFLQYAYGGCREGSTATRGGGIGTYGADGIVMVLFDSRVGESPEPGAFGGSIGYAQMRTRNGFQKGFEGGWLGMAIDEYGNFANPTEGRNGGVYVRAGRSYSDGISIRGSSGDLSGSDRYHGYAYLGGTRDLDYQIATRNTSPNRKGDKYKFRVDARDPAKLLISLQRDGGNGYQTVIEEFDAKDPIYKQSETPEKVRIAFTSGTGGGCNNHDIDELSIKGVCRVYNSDLFNKGPFGAWDVAGSDIGHKLIRTKVVNKPFSLLITSLMPGRAEYQIKDKITSNMSDTLRFYEQAVETLRKNGYSANISSFPIKVKYELVDASNMNSTEVITTTVDNGDGEMFNATKQDRKVKDFNVASAYRKVKVRFTMCADYDRASGKYAVYPYEACDKFTPDTVPPTPNVLGYRYVYSDDSFAIRPDKFNSNIAGKYIAQKPSEITFTALDASTTPKATLRYNESQGDSFNVTLTNTNSDCSILNPSFTPNVNFSDGKVTADYKLPNVSTYKLKISEIPNQEFAVIDVDDTVDDKRYITPYTSDVITVLPSSLKVDNITLNNFNNNPYTHLSDLDLDQTSNLDNTMASTLGFTVTALRDDNSIAPNYDGSCVAQKAIADINLEATQDTPEKVTEFLQFVKSDGTIGGEKRDNNDEGILFNYPIPRTAYKDGIANLSIPFNFKKDLHNPTSPFDVNISDIEVKEDIASGLSTLASNYDTNRTFSDINTTFVYSRVRASKKIYPEVIENFKVTPILSDIFCSLSSERCDNYGLDTETNIINENNWFINSRFQSVTQKDGTIGSSVEKGEGITVSNIDIRDNGVDDTVVVTNNGKQEQLVEIQLQPDIWLRYDSDNDMGFPSYEVDFIPPPNEAWSGVGTTGNVLDGNGSSSKIRHRANW